MDGPPSAGTALMLNPGANLWCFPGQGVLAQDADGLTAFFGPVAEECVAILAQGPKDPEALFAALARVAAPRDRMNGLDRLRRGGLVVAEDAVAWRAAITSSDVRTFLADGGSAADPHIVFGPLQDLMDAPVPDAPWVPVAVDLQRIVVGPLFGGSGTDPCLTCLTMRAGENDDLARLLHACRGSVLQVQAARVSPAEGDAQLAFVRDALARLADLPPGTILVRSARDGGQETARALHRGGCPDCGAPVLCHTVPGPAPLRDGGYRPQAAEAVLARLQAVVDPVTGIVRDLIRPRQQTVALGLGQVVVARHAFPLIAPDLEAVLRNRMGRSAGKGQTAAEARVGAIAEALERYAGVARPGDSTVIAPASRLDGTVLRPDELALYSADQIAAGAEWRARGAAAWVPDAFEPDARMAWTRVTDIVSGAAGWAPAALCWHQFPQVPGCAVPGRADSNGCAAGQAMADAQLQAMLELVERDAVAIWWWNRASRPLLDPGQFDDPWLDAAVRMVAIAGWRPGLFDLTHDLDVPVVAAVAWPQGGRGPLLLGFGAHPSAAVAASRAMTEVLQALPPDPPHRVGGDPRQGFGLVPGTRLDQADADEDLGFLIPQDGAAVHVVTRTAVPATAQDALASLVAGLTGRGFRIWCLDQSRPDVPLPVTRVIVPGLRHFRPRFAAGRLEGVPRTLGWKVGSARNRLFIRQ